MRTHLWLTLIALWVGRLAGGAAEPGTPPEGGPKPSCPGAHRLKVRTIVWNKRTRALISKTKPMQVQRLPAPAPPSSGGVTNGPTASLVNPSAKDELR